jgi:hypothetical protein
MCRTSLAGNVLDTCNASRARNPPRATACCQLTQPNALVDKMHTWRGGEGSHAANVAKKGTDQKEIQDRQVG